MMMPTSANGKIPLAMKKFPLPVNITHRNPLKVGRGVCTPAAATHGHGGGCCHLLATTGASVACCPDSADGLAHALVVGAWCRAAVLASRGLAHAILVGAWCSPAALAPGLCTGLCEADVNPGCVQDLWRPGTRLLLADATPDAGRGKCCIGWCGSGRWLHCANQLCTIRLPRASG